MVWGQKVLVLTALTPSLLNRVEGAGLRLSSLGFRGHRLKEEPKVVSPEVQPRGYKPGRGRSQEGKVLALGAIPGVLPPQPPPLTIKQNITPQIPIRSDGLKLVFNLVLYVPYSLK